MMTNSFWSPVVGRREMAGRIDPAAEKNPGWLFVSFMLPSMPGGYTSAPGGRSCFCALTAVPASARGGIGGLLKAVNATTRARAIESSLAMTLFLFAAKKTTPSFKLNNCVRSGVFDNFIQSPFFGHDSVYYFWWLVLPNSHASNTPKLLGTTEVKERGGQVILIPEVNPMYEKLSARWDEVNNTVTQLKADKEYLEEGLKTGGKGLFIILQNAPLPEEPVSPRKMLNMAVAGVLGLMVSVFLVFFLEFWRKSAPDIKNS
jgi:hypothetical protein